MMTALGPTAVPVPAHLRALHRRAGERAPLLRDGRSSTAHVLRDAADGRGGLRRGGPPADRRTTWPTPWPPCTPSTSTPWASGTWAAATGYVERQLRAGPGSTRACRRSRGGPRRDWSRRSARRWPQRVPPSTATTIVHGDYRLDNVVLDDGGAVAAILDWEICTLGDPLADVGLLMVYWAGPDDGAPLLGDAAPTDGARLRPRRARCSARYAETSGRDVARRRVLHGLRLLEAGLHPPGRLRPLRGRRRRRGPPAASRRTRGPCGRLAGLARPPWRTEATGEPREHARDRPSSTRSTEQPAPAIAGPGGRPGGLGGRRARRRPRRWPPCWPTPPTQPAGHLRRRPLHGPAGPAAGGPHRRRRDHRADLAADPDPPRPRPAPAPTSCTWSAPSPTSTGGEFVDAVVGLALGWRRADWWWASAPSRPRPPTPAR